MCDEIMEVPLGMAMGMGLGSGRMLLRKRELNINLPKLSEAAQSIIVSVGDQKLYQSCCLIYCSVELSTVIFIIVWFLFSQWKTTTSVLPPIFLVRVASFLWPSAGYWLPFCGLQQDICSCS